MTPGVRLDLHVHSERSPDSRLTLEVIAARVLAAGIQGFALTDHNTVDGHRPLRELAARHPDLLVVPGVEVSTAEGHLLAYGISSVPPPRRPFAETIAWVREHGGEPVPAHPFRWFHGVGAAGARRADVRSLETVNGQTSPAANRAADRLAQERGWGSTGGSDAHTVRGLARAYTVMAERPSSTDDLLEAIRRGATAAGGSSLALGGRLRWSLRNAALRARRGFRSV
ncbi:MAG: CehA/McbA family metallohydrolase [Thermoplasmata archaeon]